MSRGKATNGAIRELIVKLFNQGKTFQDIAKQINVTKSTVSDIVKKYGETGSTQISRHGAGRSRKVTSRIQRSLVRICKTDRRSTVREITAKWNEEIIGNVSQETCRRWIHKSGLHFYKVRRLRLREISYLCSEIIGLGKRKAVPDGKTKEKTISVGKGTGNVDF